LIIHTIRDMELRVAGMEVGSCREKLQAVLLEARCAPQLETLVFLTH
jgi:hypothetical protein